MPVGIQLKENANRFLIGSIINVGAGGVNISIDTLLPTGTVVIITFELQENVRFENVEARVVRTQESSGRYNSGLSFYGVSESSANKLNRYVGMILFIRGIKPFSNLTDEEGWFLRRISNELSAKPGEVIFKEGGQGDAFFIIEKGSISVQKKSSASTSERLAVLGPGEFFGEMALLDDSLRSATAVAGEASTLFVIKSSDFKQLLLNNDTLAVKLLWTFVKTLSLRVRESNVKMADSFFTLSGLIGDKKNNSTAKPAVKKISKKKK